MQKLTLYRLKEALPQEKEILTEEDKYDFDSESLSFMRIKLKDDVHNSLLATIKERLIPIEIDEGEIGKVIVNEIIKDLTDRRSLRHAWDEIDKDIQKEIKAEWKKIIAHAIFEYLKGGKKGG